MPKKWSEQDDSAKQNVTSLTLLQRVRNNDQSAWERMVHLYSPLVVHWCRRKGVHRDDVEEVVQEVWRGTSKSINEFRKDRPSDTFRGWLFGITRHRILDYFRRQSKNAQAAGGTTAHGMLASYPDPNDIDIECVDDKKEISELYLRALKLVESEFTTRTWDAFWRVAVDDRLPVDVAEELSMTANAVRMAKSRVLRRLREEIGDLGEPVD